MTRWVGSSHSSHYPAKFVDLLRQNIFDLSRDHPIEVSRDFGWISFILSHHLAKFGVYTLYESVEI